MAATIDFASEVPNWRQQNPSPVSLRSTTVYRPKRIVAEPLGTNGNNGLRSPALGGERFEPPAPSRGFRGPRRERRRKRHTGPEVRAARRARTGATGRGGGQTGVGRAWRGRGHTGQRGGFPGGWRGASGRASWAATGPPRRERMLLARRRSWRGRSSLFQESVTGNAGTETGATP